MLLAIDVGNSNTVLGAFEGAKLKKTWRMSTHPVGTADETRARVSALLALDALTLGDFKSALVASVVPLVTGAFREAFKGRNVQILSHESPFSFEISAKPRDGVGMDRLVNAEAAMREHEGPLVIVDSGTATTLCAMTADRRYLGGAILPGMELGMETLARRTAQLFSVELRAPGHAIGTNTADALKSGILLGYADMIDGMVRRFKAELGGQAKVIATGGVSRLLQGLACEIQVFDPDLTLKGIRYLHESLRAL